MSLTTDPSDPRLGRGSDSAPRTQNDVYLVLSEEERAKGFVRPVRTSYRHVGKAGPKFQLRDLTAEQVAYAGDYVKFEVYPESMAPRTGRFWSQADLDAVGKGCGTVTTMPGCYVPRGTVLACVFFDADQAAVPIASLRLPKNA